MAIMNPFRKVVGKLVDAGADGLRRASRISLRARGKQGRPANYKYTAHADGVGSITKQDGDELAVDLVPNIGPVGSWLQELTGEIGLDIDRAGLFEGGFNWSVDVSFSLPEVGEDASDTTLEEDE